MIFLIEPLLPQSKSLVLDERTENGIGKAGHQKIISFF
jgi:hypothetical protein